MHESACIPLILVVVMIASPLAWAVTVPSTTDAMLSLLLVRVIAGTAPVGARLCLAPFILTG
ncbi:MAG: hypothetical protein LBB73_09335 [Dysgonamonadaceae bacterium]|nr:hypothetical protein [Dysgonamonadaceae bacterium]